MTSIMIITPDWELSTEVHPDDLEGYLAALPEVYADTGYSVLVDDQEQDLDVQP